MISGTTRTTTLRAATALVSASALIGISAAPALAHSTSGSTSGRKLHATLTGANQVGPMGKTGVGDPNGRATVFMTTNIRTQRLCYVIKVTGIDLPAAAAHIHEAKAGANGPVIYSLNAPDASGKSSGCVSIPKAKLMEIRSNPANYYVNVHNAMYPGGAVRGQLSKKR